VGRTLGDDSPSALRGERAGVRGGTGSERANRPYFHPSATRLEKCRVRREHLAFLLAPCRRYSRRPFRLRRVRRPRPGGGVGGTISALVLGPQLLVSPGAPAVHWYRRWRGPRRRHLSADHVGSPAPRVGRHDGRLRGFVHPALGPSTDVFRGQPGRFHGDLCSILRSRSGERLVGQTAMAGAQTAFFPTRVKRAHPDSAMACPLGGGSGRAATTPPAQSGRPEPLPAPGGRVLRAALRGATARIASRSTTQSDLVAELGSSEFKIVSVK